VISAGPDEPFIVAPLPVDSAISLSVATVDTSGVLLSELFEETTSPATAHVIINEVLANPMGPEPAQEWVEIYNDGVAPAVLENYVLSDIGGHTVLPNEVLPPGGFALIVNESYDESGEYDPAAAPGTLLLRVAKLGHNGLSNQGEPLKLSDANGKVVSRFPATPKPHGGKSILRLHPKAVDGLASSFARGSTPPTPGMPNVL